MTKKSEAGSEAGANGSHSARRDAAPEAVAKGGPASKIADSLAKPLPKRFYKDVTLSAHAPFSVLLDGRPIRTPGKRLLTLPTQTLAELVAAEWRAQGTTVDPSTMPLTRFANTALDAVAQAMDAVAADITAYAGRDLLCYRADDQQPLLAQRQRDVWDPVLAWARVKLGARFEVAQGLMPIDQPAVTLDAFAAALAPFDAFGLSALHVMTTLSGSAILALAHANGALSGPEAWAAAQVDEDYQISLWGDDYEASEKRKVRRAEFDAASRLLRALR